MPWKEPKGNHQKDPWVGKKEPNPPDLDKIFAELFQKIRGLFATQKISVAGVTQAFFQKNRILSFMVALIALATIWFVFYIVNPAVVATTLKKPPDMHGATVIREAQR